MVENGGNIGKAMIAAGYTPATAKTPQKLTQSEGYKELMKQYGLTENLVATSLVEDIIAKPKARVKELGLAADILGMRASKDNGGDTFVPIQIIINQTNGN